MTAHDAVKKLGSKATMTNAQHCSALYQRMENLHALVVGSILKRLQDYGHHFHGISLVGL